jgi:NtrC-family two-component system response regulator AlgB
VDDEKNIRATLGVCLEGLGCRVTQAATAETALAALGREPLDLAFVDLRLGNQSGLDLLPKLLGESPSLAIVVITAYASFDTAVEAMRRGAWDYVPKPFSPAQIRHVVEKAYERSRLAWRIADLEGRLAGAVPEPDAVGASASPAMRAVYDVLLRAAPTDVPVLLRGETGTGKTLAARTIHTRSRRADRPFVVVNCPTLSEELLASELFGHTRGAFTGAVKDQPGRVESAHGGTLFLDEIGEIPPTLQAKLLRFLQDKEFERVGEGRTRHADVRIITATNRDLEADIRDGRFREDLLYRLNVIEVTIPPLRERREDIVTLARSFVAFYGRSLGRPGVALAAATESVLQNYEWPGNVRELQNTIERALILWPGAEIEPEALPPKLSGRTPVPAGPAVGGEISLADLEKAHIQAVLARAKSQDEAAAVLGVDASTLWRKRKRYEEE